MGQKLLLSIFGIIQLFLSLTLAQDCCENLYFGSSGILGDSEQSHIIGTYHRTQDGPNGRWYYKQDEHFESKLYYNPTFRVSKS